MYIDAKWVRLLLIATALAFISISSVYFFWYLQNPELKNLESSLKIEADQFNKEFSGRNIASGLKFGSAMAQGDKFIIVINDVNGIIHQEKKMKLKKY